MSEEEEGERKVDLTTVDTEVDARYNALMKANHSLQQSARRKAALLLGEADKFDEMAANLRQLASVLVETALQLSDSFYNLIKSEFDVISMEDLEEGEAPDDSDDDI